MAWLLELCSGAENERAEHYWRGSSSIITRETTIIRPGGSQASWKALGATTPYALFDTAKSDFYFSMGLYAGALGGTIVQFRDVSNTVHLTFVHNAGAGTISVYRGTTAGTLLATGTIVVPVSTWFVLEGHITIDDATGVVVTKINGVQDINYSGDTRNGGVASVSNWAGSASSVYSIYYDDIVFDDAAWIDDQHLIFLYPNADGATVQWTPSTGSTHYVLLDERPALDSDYIEAAAGSLFDDLDLVDYSGTGMTITGLWPLMVASATLAGEQAKVGIKIGATRYMSAAKSLGTGASLLYPGDYQATNPATAAAWTDGDLDGLGVSAGSV